MAGGAQPAVIAVYSYEVRPGRHEELVNKFEAASSIRGPPSGRRRLFRNTVPGPDTVVALLMVEYPSMAAYGERAAWESSSHQWRALWDTKPDSPEILRSVQLLTEWWSDGQAAILGGQLQPQQEQQQQPQEQLLPAATPSRRSAKRSFARGDDDETQNNNTEVLAVTGASPSKKRKVTTAKKAPTPKKAATPKKREPTPKKASTPKKAPTPKKRTSAKQPKQTKQPAVLVPQIQVVSAPEANVHLAAAVCCNITTIPVPEDTLRAVMKYWRSEYGKNIAKIEDIMEAAAANAAAEGNAASAEGDANAAAAGEGGTPAAHLLLAEQELVRFAFSKGWLAVNVPDKEFITDILAEGEVKWVAQKKSPGVPH